MFPRRGRVRKSDTGNPQRKILGGIENTISEEASIPTKRRTSSRHHMQAKQAAAATPSKRPAPEMLELGVSPIERHSSGRSRRRPTSATSAHIATSTPGHAPSQPMLPVARPEEQAPRVSFDLGCSADASSCLFDTTMASGQESRLSSPPWKRRGMRHPDSPELSVQKVRRTYSRGDRSVTIPMKLFEDPDVPDHVEEDEENFFELHKQPPVKKTRAPKPKAHKAQKENDREFDEWADKMAAEFEEIEKFELCYD